MGKGPGARLQPHTPDDAEGHRMLGAQGMMNGKKDGAAGGAAQLGPNLAGEGVQQLAQHLAVFGIFPRPQQAAEYPGPMPGASAAQCGNYRNLSLAEGCAVCAWYAGVIRD